MHSDRFLVAANLFRSKELIAAAVIYPGSFAEPSFSYVSRGRSRTSFLFQRGDRLSPALDHALNEHIRGTAISWSLVTAHPHCSPESALALAVIRAVERWVTRQNRLPSLAQTCVLIPTKKLLTDLPSTLQQITGSKDWRTAAARVLCRHRAVQDAGDRYIESKMCRVLRC
jgi:hypothetical protein